MKHKLILLFIPFILFSCTTNKNKIKESPATGNNDSTATFSWLDETCNNTGNYNPKDYTAAQLKNTFDLWYTFSGIPLHASGVAFELGEISRLNIDKLTKEYLERKALYSGMVIISTPFWNRLKEKRIQELETDYEFKKITITAYSEPSALLNNRFTKYCPDYANVLASGDSSALLAAWKQMAEHDKQKSGNPDFYMSRFYEKFNSGNRLQYAKLQLLTFGWWNCVNSNLPHTGSDTVYRKEFGKLFKTIQFKCEDAD